MPNMAGDRLGAVGEMFLSVEFKKIGGSLEMWWLTGWPIGYLVWLTGVVVTYWGWGVVN